MKDPTGADSGDQQSLRLTNERFVIPELLFHPSDVGIRQVKKETKINSTLLKSFEYLDGGSRGCNGINKGMSI